MFFLISCNSIPKVKKDQSLREYLNAIDFSGSVLVSRNNKIIHAAGYGFANKEKQISNTAETQFYMASLTKQFTALAMMQLQEQQLLNINDPIAKYLADFPNGSEITINHLLTHSAGLYDFTNEWHEIKQLNLSTQDIVDMFKDKSLNFEPGSKISYSNSGYILAGLIIEKVSGMSYADYIQSQIFKPLNMSRSSYAYSTQSDPVQAVGYKQEIAQNSVNMLIPYAAGSLTSTVTDFYLWDQSLYNSSLISASSIQKIYSTDQNALSVGTGKSKVVMGLGWGIKETIFGLEYGHGGGIDGFSTVISRFPKQKAMIVILSNQDGFDVMTLKNRIANLVLSQ
ncbi:MAG: beta-lactamase family protein [Saccharospirillaceae bacterium]|nr:beta-lactamase family protein [Pseudomonadales bacterium]NRB81088.1 beta-lactamase family protein [Saccharospirillaceae bacterium]